MVEEGTGGNYGITDAWSVNFHHNSRLEGASQQRKGRRALD